MSDKSLVHLFITGVISQITTAASIATLGGQAPALSDLAQDLGIVFNWNNGTASKTGFYGFQRSTGKFAFLPDSTVVNGVYGGTPGTLIANLQGNADTASAATKLATARTIAATGDLTWTSPAFDGTGNVTAAATLASTGVTAGTYNGGTTTITPMTFDAKGRLVSTTVPVTIQPLWTSIQSKPTTLTGFGITDGVRLIDLTPPAQGITVSGGPITSTGAITLALANDLAAVEGLTATGLVRRTATDTWSAGSPVSLTTEVSGNLPVGNLAGGTNAGATTFWRGDAAWATAVTAVTVAAANGITGTVATQGTTPVLTIVLGAITPSSVNSAGTITGNLFSGSGASLTNLPAASLTGTIATARLGSGTADATTFLSGDQTYKTALTAVSIVTANGVSGTVATGTTTPAITLTLGAITPSSVNTAGSVTAASFTGSGSGLTAVPTGSLNGTVGTANLGTGVASATTYLAGDQTWKTTPLGSVTTVSVVTANGVSGSVATATTTPAITITLGAITPTSVAATGAVSGSTLAGAGSAITALNASNLGSGTVPTARLGSGTASATTFLTGASTYVTAVTAVSVVTANGVSGSVTATGTPAITLTLGAITPTSVAATGAVSGSTLAGAGSAITALNASNLSSGTVPLAQLGATGVAGATTFLRGDNAWATAVTAVTVTTANGVSGAIATQGTTPAITITLGAITPSSVASTGTVSGTAFTGTSFAGDGSALTGLAAGNIATGTVAPARLGSGTASATTFLTGASTYVTAVTAVSVVTANGVSGSVTSTGTPAITLTLGAITPTSVAATGALSGTTIGGTTITASVGFVGPGSTITALNASNLASGTVPLAQLGSSGTPSATTFLSGTNAWATAVTAVTIVTANGVSGSVATQGTTPAITLVLGAITPTSVTSSGAVAGTDSNFSGTTTTTFLTVTNWAWSAGLTTGPGGITVNGPASFVGNVTAPANAVAATNIDCSTGNSFYKTATGVNTWTCTNVPAAGTVYEFELELTNGGLGTQTWMTGTKWPGGVIPTLTAAGVDILVFRTRDGGTTWRATATDIDSK
jgi:hypothetical protein